MNQFNEGATAPANDDAHDLDTTEGALDLGADFEAALAEMTAGDVEGAPSDAGDEGAAVTADDLDPDLDGEAPSEPALGEEGQAAPDENPNPAEDGARADQAPVVPETWSEEEKATFAALPADAQRVLSERYRSMEADYTRKTQEHAERVKLAEGIEGLVTDDLRGQLEATGLDMVGGVKALFDLQAQASSDPVGYFQRFASSLAASGIDPVQALGGGAPGNGQQPRQGDPFADPETEALKAKVAQLEGHFTAEQQAAQAAKIDAEIASFRDAVGEDGQPLRPHFAAVEGAMAQLLSSSPGMTLEAAYEQGVWMVPEAREAVLNAQREAEAKAAAERQSREAADAKRAARTNVRSGAQRPVAPASGETFEDDFLSAADELGIRLD